MVGSNRKIRWDEAAKDSFKAAISYIRKDSVQNAEKVKKDLLLKINGLKSHPERYPLDKFMKDDEGIFRAFELRHYRIRYAVTATEIVIIQIRHTSMQPL